MNSDSVKEIVDVSLWSGILNTFKQQSEAPGWLIRPENPKVLTVSEFYELAMSTEDYRELNAIAIFVWYNKFPFHEFEKRCLTRIAQTGEVNVFVDGMLYCSNYVNANNNSVFYDVLATSRRRNYLEFIVAADTLKDKSHELLNKFLQVIANSYREHPYNVLKEYRVFKKLIQLGEPFGKNCPPFVNSLTKCMKTIPKATSSHAEMCKAFGVGYKALLELIYLVDDIGYQKKQDLKTLLLETLGMSFLEWTPDERILVKNLCRYQQHDYRATCLNAKNLIWILENDLRESFTTVLRDEETAGVLACVQSETAFELVGSSVKNMRPEQLESAFKKWTPLFDVLFRTFNTELVEAYRIIRQWKKYSVFEANFLSDFTSREAFEWMKALREDRESEIYQKLMQHTVLDSPVLSEEENAELQEESEIFVAMYCPKLYESIFEGKESEEDSDEDDYDENDGEEDYYNEDYYDEEGGEYDD